MIASTTKLNTPGIALGKLDGVHALTDVTGFGLLGHLLEICRGSQSRAHVDFATHPRRIPACTRLRARRLSSPARRDATGRATAATSTSMPSLGDAGRALLTDPQTSGGLLVACAPDAVGAVLDIFRREGFAEAARDRRDRGRATARRRGLMPEGPEIRRAADALGRVLTDRPLTRIEYRVPRLAQRARTLHGARVTRVYARGKALLIEFDYGLTHYSHNQLYGEWEVARGTPATERQSYGACRHRYGDAHRHALQRDADRAPSDQATSRRHPYIASARPRCARSHDHACQ